MLPQERLALIINDVRIAGAAADQMCDPELPADVRARATRLYADRADRIVTELRALVTVGGIEPHVSVGWMRGAA